MKVYKYVNPERIDIIKNAQIRFTQPASFNDPFEMRPYAHSLLNDAYLESYSQELIKDREHLSKLIEEGLNDLFATHTQEEKEQAFWAFLIQHFHILFPQAPQNLTDNEIRDLVSQKYLELTEDAGIDNDQVRNLYQETLFSFIDASPENHKYLGDYFAQFTTQLSKSLGPEVSRLLQEIFHHQLGVLALSKTVPTSKSDHDGKNLIMWAHYTRSHEGFVIEFDANHDFFDQRLNEHDMLRHLREVKYSRERPNISILEGGPNKIDNAELTNRFSINFLCTKSKAWEYEREMRMVLPLKDADNSDNPLDGNIYLFSLPPDCITSVFLGWKINEFVKQQITDIVKRDSRYTHLEIYQAVMDEKKFILNAKRL